MKITRSTKSSIRFATRKKQTELKAVLKEYGRVVNIFIEHFWSSDTKTKKTQLLKPIVDIPKDSWLSARLRKVAAREALDMVNSVREVFDWNKEQLEIGIKAIQTRISKIQPTARKDRRTINNLHIRLKKKQNQLSMLKPHMPKHSGDRMSVSCTIAELQRAKKANRFDYWLHMASIGNKITLDLPINSHRHFKKLLVSGQRLNSYVITKDSVQFSFEIETGPKKEVKHSIGVDTGINALASTSDGNQYGTDIKAHIERVKRCQWGSKGHKRASNALRQRIDEVAKQTVRDADLIVVEKLSDLNKNSKLKRRLSQNMRRSIGSSNLKYWLGRLEQQCELNRVSFRSVPSYYTSQRCPACSHTDSGNRSGEIFLCQRCGHSDNADINAAKNILERHLTGPYGACYKPKEDSKLECPVLSTF